MGIRTYNFFFFFQVRKLCSKAMTCGELMKLGLEEFDMKEEDTRMFDYHGDKR